MADVKWIKIATNIFDNDKFDAIEALPDGLMIELAWLKLLCLAGKCNCGGMLVIADEIPYTDEMLAKRFHMEIGVVQRAIDQFERLGMVEVVDSAYMVSNWSRYQDADKLEEMNRKERERKQRYREKKKLMLGDGTKDGTGDGTKDGLCSISISSSFSNNLEEDRGVGEEETFAEKQRKEDIKKVVDYLNTVCGTRYRAATDETRKHINARMDEGYIVGDFKVVIDVKASQWLNDPKMRKYLRPSTLFAPSKFESYLNEGGMAEHDDDPMRGIV